MLWRRQNGPQPPPCLADGLVWLALTVAAVAGVAAWAGSAAPGPRSLPPADRRLCLAPVEHSDGCGLAHPTRLACADGWARLAGASPGGEGRLAVAGDRTCQPSVGAPARACDGGMRPAWRLLTGIGLDINQADAAALQLLPRIGPRMAERIVAHRRAHGDFGSPEELRAVAGIGPKVWAGLAPQVRVAPSPAGLPAAPSN